MLRRPKIKEREFKEFDQKLFQEEVRWLTRIKEGKVLTSISSFDLYPAFFTASIFAFLFGLTMGIAITYFTKNILWFLLFPVFTFSLVFYLSLKPYSTVHIDTEENKMQYEGIIMYAGDERTANYRGPIDVIDKTQIIQMKRPKRFHIRFVTNSGYMRLNFRPEEDSEFLLRLQDLDLLDLEQIKSNITNDEVLKMSNNVKIYYEKSFDRSEFKKILKEKRDEEERIRLEKLEEKKRLLIEKSKNRQSKN